MEAFAKVHSCIEQYLSVGASLYSPPFQRDMEAEEKEKEMEAEKKKKEMEEMEDEEDIEIMEVKEK